MKREYLAPLSVLSALLLLSLWNGRAISQKVSHLQQELLQADQFAAEENWPAAEATLQQSYRHWDNTQTFFHIATHHDIVDEAESLYHQAQTHAAEQNSADFRAALTALTVQLQQLSETERCSIRNIL